MDVIRQDLSEARERDLLARVAARDRQGFDELFRMYHGRLFKFVFRLTRSYAVADELANDILLLVWNRADTFRGDSKVSTWIFGIAYRQSMRHLSRSKTLPEVPTDPDELASDPLASSSTEDWVEKGLALLPPAQRLTTLLVFYVGLSYEEVAKVTECPVNTVKTRMFHARRKLREVLPEIASPAKEQAQA